MSIHPIAIAQLAMLVFFAILFLQSGIDKVADRKGNLEWMEPHFAKSPFKATVRPLLTLLTVFELAAGVLCVVAAGAIAYFCLTPPPEESGLLGFLKNGGEIYLFTQAKTFVQFAALLVLATILQLFLGQRLAKDYAGAASLVPYFVVGVLLLFSVHFSLPAEIASRWWNPN